MRLHKTQHGHVIGPALDTKNGIGTPVKLFNTISDSTAESFTAYNLYPQVVPRFDPLQIVTVKLRGEKIASCFSEIHDLRFF